MNETEDAGNQIAWPEAARYHLESGWYPARAADYSEDVRTRVELGTKVSAFTYLQALEKRGQFIRQFHAALENAGVDALAVPTTPIPAPRIGEEQTSIGATNHPTRALLLRLNRPANLAGIPAISIPCGFTDFGLPVGLQLIAAHNNESLLLRVAAIFQNANPLNKRPALAPSS
jgi:Asp-tRNA(Asn)/Glu-tRNA(Gln) amidotransferase A subunit family amidase